MKISEFLKKYISNKDIVVLNDGEIKCYRQFVDLRDNDNIVKLRLCDISRYYGFEDDYSVKNVYSELTSKWDDIDSADDIFFLEDRFVAIKNEDGHIKQINLISYHEKQGKRKYNFKNLAYVQEIYLDKQDKKKIAVIGFYKEIIKRFTNTDASNIETDIIIECTYSELIKLFKDTLTNKNSHSYSYIIALISIYNELFENLNLNIRYSYSDVSDIIDSKVYYKKDKIISLCEQLDTYNAFILYGFFMCLGHNDAEVLSNLKFEMIDVNQKIIHYKDKEITVDDYFIELAKECNNLKGVYKDSDFIEFDKKNEYVIKMIPPKAKNRVDTTGIVTVQRFRSYLRDISKRLDDDNIVGRFLYRSGVLHRMHELHKQTGVEYNLYIIKHKIDLEYTYTPRDCLDAYLNTYN